MGPFIVLSRWWPCPQTFSPCSSTACLKTGFPTVCSTSRKQGPCQGPKETTRWYCEWDSERQEKWCELRLDSCNKNQSIPWFLTKRLLLIYYKRSTDVSLHPVLLHKLSHWSLSHIISMRMQIWSLSISKHHFKVESVTFCCGVFSHLWAFV